MRRVRAGRICVGLAAALVWAISAPSAWAHGSHGSSGGSSGGSHGSSGGSSGGWHHGRHHGGWHSHGSSGGSSGGIRHHAPHHNGDSYTPQQGGDQQAPAPAPAPANGMAVRLTVTLPEEAKLFIENQPTQLTGARRDFLSPRLKAGQEYIYTLRAELNRNGTVVSKTEQFRVRAGQRAQIEFTLPSVNATELVAVRR